SDSDTEINYIKKFKQNINFKLKKTDYEADKNKLKIATIISTIHRRQQYD
ncbi:2872_t:CDS:1, partial [Racocetra fulgida]